MTDCNELHLAITSFVACYHAVPYRVLDRRFFGGKSCGTAVKNLSESDPNDHRKVPLLKRHVRSIAKNRHSYVQLSAAGARRFGVSKKRSEPFNGAALSLHIAKAWFCVMAEHPRLAASREDLLPFFDKDTPRSNVPHVFATAEELGHPTILRIYHVVSDIRTSVKHLEQMARSLNEKPIISKWVRDRTYGVGVMCTTEKNLEAMRHALDESALKDHLLLVTDLGPTTETLAQVL